MTEPREDAVDVAVVIVNWRVPEALRACLDALPAALRRDDGRALSATVQVVDNEPEPATAALRAAHPRAAWIDNPENRGFSAACNQGIRATRSRHVLLLNPDTRPDPGSIAALVDWLDAHPDAAVAGPRLVNPEGALELTCRRFPRLRYLLADLLRLSRLRPLRPLFARYYYGEWDYRSARAVDQVSGACFLMRRSAIEAIGLLDERFFVYFEEVDWCLRARRAGYLAHYVPAARVVHIGGAASRQAGAARVAYTHASARAYWAKHHGRAAGLGLELVLALERALRWLLRRPGPPGGVRPCAESPAS